MDSSIVFALAAAAAFTCMLVADIVVAAFRCRQVLRRRLGNPIRLVVGSTICATVLLGAGRPALATTPPPSVRLLDVVSAAEPQLTHEQRSGPTYIVEPGDSLWRIARSILLERGENATGRDIAAFWPLIYEANEDVIGSDPNLIHPGDTLVVPGDRTVVEGDVDGT